MKATENKKTKEHSRKNKETGKLSDRDLRDLMGMNRLIDENVEAHLHNDKGES